jgi:Tfp pilus assembly major pilin PilA
MSVQNRQQGGSAIGLMIFLAVFAYGVFIAIQYVPQYIESATVKRILDNIADTHHKERLKDERAVSSAINKQLYINQMNDLENSFTVTPSRGHYIITVHYERELNLLYTNKKMLYEETVTLE